MSYLKSILDSIEGNNSVTTTSNPPQPRPNGVSTDRGTNGTGGPKRKATDDIDGFAFKVQKQLPPVQPDNTSANVVSVPAPYRGTSRPDFIKQPAKTVAKPQTISQPPNLVQTSSRKVAPEVKTEKRPVSAPAPSSTNAAPPVAAAPKKGSYAEIMARAKAAKEMNVKIGTIQHKQTEKLTRRERLALQEAAKVKGGVTSRKVGEKSKTGERIKAGDRSRTGSSETSVRKSGELVKEKSKSLDLGYKGTMRPISAEPTYKGTMGLTRPGQPRKPLAKDTYRAGASADRGARYVSYSEDEEDGDDYASDVSSDMEAGVFDVDREEDFSTKIARQEDAKEAAAEAEARRRKQQRLAKMNAERSKKRVY